MPELPSTSPQRIAFFLSTSGHSGVDRVAKHLLPALARRGYAVDLLKVRRHGPELNDTPIRASASWTSAIARPTPACPIWFAICAASGQR
jgi:hypothetical protein